jgi:serine/threonine-protein kinase
MLTREGVAKLTDFGIARAVGVPGLTQTGMVLGTPAYMAPEQIQGHQVDKRADIYSLGVTLYEMVAGRVPFEKPKDSDSDYQVLRAHIEEPPQPPSRLVATIPPFIEAAILRAMAKQRDDRFASCEEFGAALVPPELPPTRRVVAGTPPRLRESEAAVAPGAGALPPASLEAARPRVAPGPPEPLHVAKPVAPRRAPAKVKTRAGYLWALFVLAVALGVGGYWLYRVQPGPAPAVEPPATRQTPPAPVVDRPAERPGPVPSQRLPAQPSAAELAAQVQPLINQAKEALDRGEYDAAISAYRRALELDATNQEARRGIDRAQRAKAAELAAQVQALINQANVALESGEYDAAIAAYRRALELDATNQEARRGVDRAQSAKAAEEATQ